MPLSCNGFPINMSEKAWGLLRESNDILYDKGALRERAEEDGYIFIRGLLEFSAVMKAREEILLKYAIVGEIDSTTNPVIEGILRSHNYVSYINLEALVTSIRCGAHFENVVVSDRILDLYERIFGEAAQAFDYRWPRMMRVGEGCGIHADIPYVGRGTKKVWTSWIPIGDVPLINGPLTILEGSHRNSKFHEYFDKDAAKEEISWLERDPSVLQDSVGGRWLSAEFRAGDVLCFSGYIVHAALDNNSPEGKCRLSSDTRFQPKSHAKDSRWFGKVSNPYGNDYEKGKRVFYPGLIKGDDMNSDLTEEWKPVGPDGRLLTA